MSFPLDNHLHLCEPRLNELSKSKAALNQLLLKNARNKVIWFDDEHSVNVGYQLLEEDVTIGQSDKGSRLDQIGAALN